jgi:acyl carrier protein
MQLEPALQRLDPARRDLDDSFNLLEGGLLDSFGFLNLVSALEEKTGRQIDFSDLDPSEFTTLGGLVRWLSSPPPP